jgi:hypothetical protein
VPVVEFDAPDASDAPASEPDAPAERQHRPSRRPRAELGRSRSPQRA